jgi:acyl dehydratase
VDRRQPSSRSDVGIVTLADELTDGGGNQVLTQQVTVMVARRT